MWQEGKHSANLWVAATWRQWDFWPIESKKTEGIPEAKANLSLYFGFFHLLNCYDFNQGVLLFPPDSAPHHLTGKD